MSQEERRKYGFPLGREMSSVNRCVLVHADMRVGMMLRLSSVG